MFLLSDVLAVSGEVLWKWPFTLRQESLDKLLNEDTAAVMTHTSDRKKSKSVPVNTDEQNEYLVKLEVNQHKPSTPDEVLKCLSDRSPYPCNGLMFIPNTAYVFGSDPLLFKWQNDNSLECDSLLTELESRNHRCVFPSVAEHHKHLLEEQAEELFLEDKTALNSDGVFDYEEKISQQPYAKKNFITDLTEIRNIVDSKETKKTTVPSTANYPSLGYSFDEFYAKITELVELGDVEKTVDSTTNLQILNCSTFVCDP